MFDRQLAPELWDLRGHRCQLLTGWGKTDPEWEVAVLHSPSQQVRKPSWCNKKQTTILAVCYCSRTMGQHRAEASKMLTALKHTMLGLRGLAAWAEVPRLPTLSLESGKTNTPSRGSSVLKSLQTHPDSQTSYYCDSGSATAYLLGLGLPGAAPWRVYPCLTHRSCCYLCRCAHSPPSTPQARGSKPGPASHWPPRRTPHSPLQQLSGWCRASMQQGVVWVLGKTACLWSLNTDLPGACGPMGLCVCFLAGESGGEPLVMRVYKIMWVKCLAQSRCSVNGSHDAG